MRADYFYHFFVKTHRIEFANFWRNYLGEKCVNRFSNRSTICVKRGFSLVECVLALALFSFAAFVISQVCYNCVYPLSMQDKNPLEDVVIEQGIQTILDVVSYEDLDDGAEFKTLDGTTCRVYGEYLPTQIIDLFELKIRIEADGIEPYTESVFVIRPKWYENSNDRDILLEDRTDLLEDKRLEDYEKLRDSAAENKDEGYVDFSKKF